MTSYCVFILYFIIIQAVNNCFQIEKANQELKMYCLKESNKFLMRKQVQYASEEIEWVFRKDGQDICEGKITISKN